MARDDPEIAFVASVYKIQTLVDGGIRLTLDLPETAITQAALLMECQRQALGLNVNCLTIKNKSKKSHDVGKGKQRKSKWQTQEESGLDGDS